MARNIVILLDGTSNQISVNRSNVLRFYGTLEKDEDQIVWYDPGVGTLGAPNAWLRVWAKAVEVFELATGHGLDRNVKEAYRFLVETYRGRGAVPGERDRISIVGFSRGAYSARVLAGLIHTIGLIEPRNLNLVDYVYRAYKNIGEGSEGRTKRLAEARFYQRALRPDRPPVHALGLFDTVSSLIEHGRIGLRLRSHAFTRYNPGVRSVRHALAIDERRTMFQPQLWGARRARRRRTEAASAGARSPDVREVWFAGVHGDVGGGYPEVQSGTAKIPLQWLIRELRDEPAGLRFDDRAVASLVLGEDTAGKYAAPSPTAELHNSMNAVWAIMEFIPRRRPWRSRRRGFLGLTIPFFERRVVPEGALIHRSVEERMNATGYRPPNLPSRYEIVD